VALACDRQALLGPPGKASTAERILYGSAAAPALFGVDRAMAGMECIVQYKRSSDYRPLRGRDSHHADGEGWTMLRGVGLRLLPAFAP
jgi:hypothetical protein